MTEVPEHLLKRSRERRAAATGEGSGDSGETASSETAPVAAAAATPAPAAPATPAVPEEVAPPPPPPPHVQAALNRRRIPYWAMPVLAFLPIWAYLYQGTLEPAPKGVDPIAEGATLFADNGCSGCHGAGGGGGVGPAFAGGAIYKTWPDWRDHFRWVRLGNSGWNDEVGPTYGAQNKKIDLSKQMPSFAIDKVTDAQLILILNYERHELGGEPPDADADAALTALAEAAAENPDATYEELLTEAAAILAEAGVDEDATTIKGPGSPEAAG